MPPLSPVGKGVPVRMPVLPEDKTNQGFYNGKHMPAGLKNRTSLVGAVPTHEKNAVNNSTHKIYKGVR